ncbi:arginine--tRNA ligase [Patescibacteria group bacterium]
MIKDKIAKLLKKNVGQDVELEHPAKLEFGDYSTNIALKAKIDPEKIVEKLKDNPLFEKVEIVNGFINFTLSKKVLLEELEKIIDKKENYGNLKIGKGKKIQVEFISANPTGPLTVGNARGGPFGDTLANVLHKAGYNVEKEYYVNNYGKQIESLGHSVLKDDQAKYNGEYIDKLNKKNIEKDVYKTGEWAAKEIINNYIKKTIGRLGIKFDIFFEESELHKEGKVDEVIKFLENKDLIYKKEGAVWFKAEQFGDNRDRVIIKSNGLKTYLAGDIAHHYYKFKEKEFEKVINIWGADHHGDVAGLMAGVEAIGYKGKLEIILLQFVTLMDKGVSKKISKRAGDYVTLDELIDEVGKDAVRFMFLQKSPDTHLNFDIELTKEQSKKNPVFYVQYSFARISSIIENSSAWVLENTDLWVLKNSKLSLLVHSSELNLIRQLIKFSEIIEDTTRDYQVQRLPYYAIELANRFHKFYEDCRVLDDNNLKLMMARLSLIKATQIILKNTLNLMGVSAPEKM